MNINKFGKVIKEVRIIRNMTQQQLAENICSRRQIIRIENGEHEPSPYLITLLSQKLNFDLQACYYNIKFGKSIKAYTLKLSLYTAIENQDIQTIKELIPQMEVLEEYKSGEYLQLLYYAKALYSSLYEKDYIRSNKFCISGLCIDNPKFSLENSNFKNLSQIGYILLHTLGFNYMYLNKNDIADKIYENLLELLEIYPTLPYNSFYKYSDVDKNLFQSVYFNFSAMKYRLKDFNSALIIIEKGINFCIEQYSSKFLPEMLLKKFCILCRLQRFEEAKIVYNECYYLVKLINNENLAQSLESDYQELFVNNPNNPLPPISTD